MSSSAGQSLTPFAAWLDHWSRAILPYIDAQTLCIVGVLVFFVFLSGKYRKTKEIPSTDDCLRVGLTTVTLLTALVAILGLLLPTPPAPPELSAGVLRTVGLTSGIALTSYALKILKQLFKD